MSLNLISYHAGGGTGKSGCGWIGVIERAPPRDENPSVTVAGILDEVVQIVAENRRKEDADSDGS